MDKLKLGIFSVVILSIVTGVGYWAIITMQSGTEYVNNQKIRKLESENADLKDQVTTLSAQVSAAAAAPKPVEPTPAPVPTPKPATTKKPTTKTTTKKPTTTTKTPAKKSTTTTTKKS